MLKPDLFFAQINPLVGDIEGNSELIIAAYRQKSVSGNSLIITPELSLIGYPPEDLLLIPSFRALAMQEARAIAAATTEAGLIFGSLWEEGGEVYNAAIFAAGGRILHIHHKIMLPNYGVFDEKRYFVSGNIENNLKSLEWRGLRLALMVCEDIWHEHIMQEVKKSHPDLIIAINASPFELGKQAERKKIAAKFAQTVNAELCYVNMVGAQDDLVFDGGSFMVSKEGYIKLEVPQFVEGVFFADENIPENKQKIISNEESIWSAMKLGLADYVRKNGFSGVLLGLSGGIDSAVTAACAVDALGSDMVRGVLLPSPYTSQESIDDALETARLLGIRSDIILINSAMEIMETSLSPLMSNIMEDLSVGGNIQARIRGQILMAISNKTGFMLLSTGNKSEIAVGYTTLYGDSCGGYNLLKDIYKTQIYKLANWRNQQSCVIPLRSISKAPTAELKPDQKDSDQLPEYALLDQILALHIEGKKSAGEIISQGFEAEIVKRVVNMVKNSEYKRRQSCPGVKISSQMFGRDRRFPLTCGTIS